MAAFAAVWHGQELGLAGCSSWLEVAVCVSPLSSFISLKRTNKQQSQGMAGGEAQNKNKQKLEAALA